MSTGTTWSSGRRVLHHGDVLVVAGSGRPPCSRSRRRRAAAPPGCRTRCASSGTPPNTAQSPRAIRILRALPHHLGHFLVGGVVDAALQDADRDAVLRRMLQVGDRRRRQGRRLAPVSTMRSSMSSKRHVAAGAAAQPVAGNGYFSRPFGSSPLLTRSQSARPGDGQRGRRRPGHRRSAATRPAITGSSRPSMLTTWPCFLGPDQGRQHHVGGLGPGGLVGGLHDGEPGLRQVAVAVAGISSPARTKSASPCTGRVAQTQLGGRRRRWCPGTAAGSASCAGRPRSDVVDRRSPARRRRAPPAAPRRQLRRRLRRSRPGSEHFCGHRRRASVGASLTTIRLRAVLDRAACTT